MSQAWWSGVLESAGWVRRGHYAGAPWGQKHKVGSEGCVCKLFSKSSKGSVWETTFHHQAHRASKSAERVRSQVGPGMEQGEQVKSRTSREGPLKLLQKGPVSPSFVLWLLGKGDRAVRSMGHSSSTGAGCHIMFLLWTFMWNWGMF